MALIIAIVAVMTCAFLGLVFQAVQRVSAGQGLNTYRTARLVEFTSLGALASLAVLAVALCIGLLIRAYGLLDRWRFLREIRAARKSRNV